MGKGLIFVRMDRSRSMRFFAFGFAFLLLVFASSKSLVYLDFVIDQERIARELCVERSVPESCCAGKCVLEERLNRLEEAKGEAQDTALPELPEGLVLLQELPDYSLPEILQASLDRCLPASLGEVAAGHLRRPQHPPARA